MAGRQSRLIDFLVSDAFLSSLLLFTLALISIKAIPISRSTILDARRSVNDVVFGSYRHKNRALSAFYHYEKLATIDVDQMRRSYSRLSRSHKRIGYELGYPSKLDRLVFIARVNSIVSKSIARVVLEESGITNEPPAYPMDNADISKVREALKHLVRDWSCTGASERNATFMPIMHALSNFELSHRQGLKVLVPGSGLGRLAWQINQMGFDVTAVEMSPFMNFAFRFLLSPQATQEPEQHTIHPYAHWFSHQRSNDNLFRPISFPDVIPRLSSSFHHIEGDFLALETSKQILGGHRDSTGYDLIVTLFFIDTSLNIIATLEKIRDLLRPGGTWINLGPLLWTGGSQASMELSLDEVLALAEKVGFEVDLSSRRTLDCEYTADAKAMMKWIYNAEFWTAKLKS